MASRSKGGWASGKRARAAIAAVVILTVVLVGVGPAPIRTARGAPQASTPIDSCRTISSPGAYALTDDIETERSSCIEITANDVVLDGNQHAVTGNDSGVGISVDGAASSPITNVTVTNVTATDWDRGISYENANRGTVSHAIAGGSRAGIALDNSVRVRVLNSTATSNVFGFYLDGTTDSEVRGSTATLNRWGVAFEGGSSDNTIRRTVSTDNSQWDLHSREDSRTNRVVSLDVGSGTFSLAETNLRARGAHTGENVFRSPPTAPRGWNDTGTYLEVDPVGDAPIGTVTATYAGQAGSPLSLSLWRYDGSWSRLQSNVNTRTNTVSARSVSNGTVALFAKPGQSIESETLDRRSDSEPPNANPNQDQSRASQITLTQGEQCYPLSALGNGTQPVEKFYGYRTPYTDPNNSKGWYQAYGEGANRLERANTSQLFIYNGTDGLSLVFLHDGRSVNDASGGTVTANIGGLPESGNWTVQDDHYHEQDDVWAVAPGRSRAHIEWVWNFGNRSDGGAFVGLGTGNWQRITIEMGFNEQSVRYPFEVWNGPPAANHVDRWIARSGSGETYALDMNRSVTLVRGSCNAAGTTQSATTQTATGTGTVTGTATSASQQTTAPASASTSTQTTTGDSGSQASTGATSTGSDTPSEPAGLLSAITDANGQEFLGLGVLLVALVVLALAVFRR